MGSKRIPCREEGQTIVEYLLLVAIVSLLMLNSLAQLHERLSQWLPNANQKIAGALSSGRGFQK
ncbi:MAG: hypothetical protein HY391_03800 [Deltaproteobacteria bacterium]|nr:hypothetical protein [Deltaproteobacteria bacterium]